MRNVVAGAIAQRLQRMFLPGLIVVAAWWLWAQLIGQVCERVAFPWDLLLAHGTMPLIRAGVQGVPCDRANSILELRTGDALVPKPFLARLDRGYYDRIYINSAWYGPGLDRAIARKYRLVQTLGPAMPERSPRNYQTAYRLLGEIRVYEPKPATLRAAQRDSLRRCRGSGSREVAAR